jgi:hypothetical protein
VTSLPTPFLVPRPRSEYIAAYPRLNDCTRFEIRDWLAVQSIVIHTNVLDPLPAGWLVVRINLHHSKGDGSATSAEQRA